MKYGALNFSITLARFNLGMTARKYCAATADNNLLSLPDLPCFLQMVRCSLYASVRSLGENMTRQIFSFVFRAPA